MARSSARSSAADSVSPKAAIISGNASSARRPIIRAKSSGVISRPRRRNSSRPERLKISSVLNIRPSKSKTTALIAPICGRSLLICGWLGLSVTQVEDVHRMSDPDRRSGPAEGRLNLQRAARVARDDDLRIAGKNVSQLSLRKPLRHLGFGQVVAAGGPAADFRLRQRHQLEARDQGQETPRLLANPLSVDQMASVVVNGPKPEFPGWRQRTQLGQKLRHIADLGRKLSN